MFITASIEHYFPEALDHCRLNEGNLWESQGPVVIADMSPVKAEHTGLCVVQVFKQLKCWRMTLDESVGNFYGCGLVAVPMLQCS